ncbi:MULTISPECIES: DUF1028 domain-containing protein [unclassified Chelatococcus]|uniref:DUF1028 domain-containing protein n=1 Tax=unclassified Chelatococcus TaxID=2638111 RepID=UPI001BD19031|nr:MULTISPECIES: DUF1028 domain-containing protein [unclassified Chelatococcus]MBS7700995.1 DUF1028 domain-containing protein [Chelatococcus sp. YT9]MBX3555528.1 DUF1028 domain-containing protein [Chelatococcus sp.]
MTFTIVARDPDTRQLGICLATSPLGVASRCPHVRGGVAAISSQCHSNWRLGHIGLDLAARGLSPDEILRLLASYDPHFHAYRQVGIVTVDGAAAAHSPPKGAAWTGHRVGTGFVAMGNGLAGPQVVDAIHDTFASDTGIDFAERLVRAIEAGYAAGGEPKGQASAGLVVSAPGCERPLVDLRIDMANPLPKDGGDAVRDLRRAFDAYKPLIPYYADYWLDHPEVSYTEWQEKAA